MGLLRRIRGLVESGTGGMRLIFNHGMMLNWCFILPIPS